MIKKYVEVLKQKDSKEGNKHLITKGFCYGDWLALDGINEVSTNGGTDTDFVMNIYYYHIVDIASKVANELGKTDDYTSYNTLKEEIKSAILKYFSDNGKISVTTQTGYILALYYNIYIDKDVLFEGFKRRLMFDSYKLKKVLLGLL